MKNIDRLIVAEVDDLYERYGLTVCNQVGAEYDED